MSQQILISNFVSGWNTSIKSSSCGAVGLCYEKQFTETGPACEPSGILHTCRVKARSVRAASLQEHKKTHKRTTQTLRSPTVSSPLTSSVLTLLSFPLQLFVIFCPFRLPCDFMPEYQSELDFPFNKV